jgi:hypothetical protein
LCDFEFQDVFTNDVCVGFFVWEGFLDDLDEEDATIVVAYSGRH